MLVALLAAGCLVDFEDLVTDDAEPEYTSDPSIPELAYCEPAQIWDASWIDFELDVLALVNNRRATGATCGDDVMPAVSAVGIDGALTCAARIHSVDMDARGFFSHSNPDGLQPWDRMDSAGYRWRAAGENIAFGQPNPEEVMSDWMGSPGHCANIMSPNFIHIGIGFYGDATMWTQAFGSPR